MFSVIDFHGPEVRIPFYVEGNLGTSEWNFNYTQLPCSETVTRKGNYKMKVNP
jgi:hypothetical protein